MQKIQTDRTWYYQTRMQGNYCRHFERKISGLSGDITQVEGIGASLSIRKNNPGQHENVIFPFSTGIPSMSAAEFLEQYQDDIKNIPPVSDSSLFVKNLEQASSRKDHLIMTLVPLAASFKKDHPQEDIHSIFEMTKTYAVEKIEKLLSTEIHL